MFLKLSKQISSFLVTYPKRTFFVFILVFLVLLAFVSQFRVDASADTLLNKKDPDFLRMQAVSKKYATAETLFVVFTPYGDLFSDSSLNTLARLDHDLTQLPSVSSVISLLDVPLFKSSSLSLIESVKALPTITSPLVDRQKARIEFVHSPLYKDLLISKNAKTTALQVTFKPGFVRSYRQDIVAIRSILSKYTSYGEVYLGGIGMISNDMIAMVWSDVWFFGASSLLIMVVILFFIFRQPRYIFVSVLSCFISVLMMMGLLGLFDLKVTVISSNFISLQIILTLSLVIHLVVRYRELLALHPDMPQKELVFQSMFDKMVPSFFTTLTTILGFASLVLCNIKPVITFGWIMVVGLFVSIIVTFVFFGCVMCFLKPIPVSQGSSFSGSGFVTFFARITDKYRYFWIFLSLSLLALGSFGISKLTVENSFIKYFKKDTAIYQTLSYVDRHLGGTTPFDLIVKLNTPNVEPVSNSSSTVSSDADFELFSEINSDANTDPKYWFTSDKVELAKKIHRYLESFPHTGKVLSLATPMSLVEELNGNKSLDNFQLAVLYESLPPHIRSDLVNQYVNVKDNELRFSVRVYDSDPTLRRAKFISDLKKGLEKELGLSKDQYQLSGIMILYNNMLQALFNSQILTLGTSMLFLVGVLWVLFRSLKLAFIAVVPNAIAIVFILGFMGFMKIPLDMMTITIASITLGIGVEDAIHYIYHYLEELEKDHNPLAALYRSHQSIGLAMSFTSLVVSLGFGVLVFSSFIPNILFGLLTALAMCLALFASLTVLPALLLIFYKRKA